MKWEEKECPLHLNFKCLKLLLQSSWHFSWYTILEISLYLFCFILTHCAKINKNARPKPDATVCLVKVRSQSTGIRKAISPLRTNLHDVRYPGAVSMAKTLTCKTLPRLKRPCLLPMYQHHIFFPYSVNEEP